MKYVKCSCGHIVEIDEKYGWNLCSKCGEKHRVNKDKK